MITVGPFDLDETRGGYPVWFTVKNWSGQIRFDHRDLMHLKHLVTIMEETVRREKVKDHD